MQFYSRLCTKGLLTCHFPALTPKLTGHQSSLTITLDITDKSWVGFTDASDSDYPGMDTCVYCMYGKEVQNVHPSGNVNVVQGTDSSQDVSEIASFITCHSHEFERSTVTKEQLHSMVSTAMAPEDLIDNAPL